MDHTLCSFALSLSSQSEGSSNNKHPTPIVLVNGLGGWSRAAYPKYPYWGRNHGDFPITSEYSALKLVRSQAIGTELVNYMQSSRVVKLIMEKVTRKSTSTHKPDDTTMVCIKVGEQQ